MGHNPFELKVAKVQQARQASEERRRLERSNSVSQQGLKAFEERAAHGRSLKDQMRQRTERQRDIDAHARARAARRIAGLGTDPKDIFGEAGAQLCTDFLEFAASHGNKGSNVLIDRSSSRKKFQIGGYGIGCLVLAEWVKPKDPKVAGKVGSKIGLATSLDQNVFLGLDSTIWLFTNQPIADNYGKSSFSFHKSYDKSPPDTLNGLPVGSDGRIVIPQIGRLVTGTATDIQNVTYRKEFRRSNINQTTPTYSTYKKRVTEPLEVEVTVDHITPGALAPALEDIALRDIACVVSK